MRIRAAATAAVAVAAAAAVHAPPRAVCAADAAPAPATPPLEGLELKQAHVIFRHGARAPLSTKHGSGDVAWNVCGRAYEAVAIQVLGVNGDRPPGQGAADARQRSVKLQGGCHLGELTLVGQTQARELGTALRARYAAALLPGAASAAAAGPALAVRSSNVQRTIATAAGVLTGLFPTVAAATAAAHAPAPIRVGDDAVEWLYPNFEACARLRWLWRQRVDRAGRGGDGGAPKPGADAWRRPFEPQLAALADALRGSPDDVAVLSRAWGVVELMDHATARAAHGMPPLGATTAANVTDLRAMAAAVVADVFTGGAATRGEARVDGLKLSVGRLFADVAASLDAAASRRTPLRMALYSGHDTTLLPVLLALREGPPGSAHSTAAAHPPLIWPPFASSVVIELWGPPPPPPRRRTADGGAGAVTEAASARAAPTDGGGATTQAHYVRVLSNFEPMALPCAGGAPHGACRLADFKAALAPFVPADFSEECAVTALRAA